MADQISWIRCSMDDDDLSLSLGQSSHSIGRMVEQAACAMEYERAHISYEDDEDSWVASDGLALEPSQLEKLNSPQMDGVMASHMSQSSLEQLTAEGQPPLARMKQEADGNPASFSDPLWQDDDMELRTFCSRSAERNPTNFPDLIWQDSDTGGRVYIGNSFTSSSQALLQQYDINCIVNCTEHLQNHFEDNIGYSYVRFDRIDAVFTKGVVLPPAAVPELFSEVFGFIDQAVAAGRGVLLHCVAGAHRAGTTGCAFIMHRDSSLTCQQAITHCKSRRAIVDPAIWPFLMGLLEALDSSYCGSGTESVVQLGNTTTLDLNVEGWKVLADQLDPTCDNQETLDDHTEHFQAADRETR